MAGQLGQAQLAFRLPPRTRLWFWCLLGLVALQLGWWTFFHLRFSRQQARLQQAAWQAQLSPAGRALQAACHLAALQGEGPPPAAAVLAMDYPDLQLVPLPGARSPADACMRGWGLQVHPQRPRRLSAQAGHHLRMFAFEGSFFAAALALGARAVWRSLRQEVGLVRQQANFLSAVTHELKTPLASLRLFAETLQLRPLDATTTAHYLHTMVAQVERLEVQVANLLTAARLDTGALARCPGPIELNEAVASWVREAQQAIGPLQLPVSWQPAAEAVWASLDGPSIACAVRNLLDNARKYGQLSQQPCVVRVRAAAQQAIIEVCDRGLGLSAGEVERIFAKFYRVGDEMVRKSEGSGLGLFLVRALTEANGGTATATSDGPQLGATFRLTFAQVAAPESWARVG